MKISESVAILDTQSFAEALNYAVEELKADVVTMSMAGIPSKRMAAAVNKAYENGVVVVTAAGNTWSQGIKQILPDKIMYPARFDRVIAVTGATLYHTPYQNDINENWNRGSRWYHMQLLF
ncbi:MAG: S8/S53 family peptidase [Saprospiraceae bacterium]|nr:S8/S53 family peptidase [Saprospiraceae bacterium]